MEPTLGTVLNEVQALAKRMDDVINSCNAYVNSRIQEQKDKSPLENLYLLTRLGETLPLLVGANLLSKEKAVELVEKALTTPQETVSGGDMVLEETPLG